MNAYWTALDEELAAVPSEWLLRQDPYRTTDEWDFFFVEFPSIGHRGSGRYRVAGYLSVPRAEGPLPAVLEIPRHGSVNHTPHSNDRSRYVILTLMHRGQRLADQPYRAEYPGLLIDGIDDPAEYVYRGIVADALRAAELLFAHPKVDRSRVAAVGEDLGLLVAARRPGFAAVRVDGLLLTSAWERAARTRGYPMESLNDLRRHAPEDAVARAQQTSALFDPAQHAAGIDAAVLVTDADPASAPALLEALGDAAEHFVPTGRDREDDDARDAWLAQRLGVPAASRFAATAVALPGE
ncbi:acetylxylan esterase [Microbacterium sp. 179-I 3D4 NHS]|uniref:acetylxylan esterase n=1 Tax=Microbacterium sp. 179-I 3D4 NHS TaxID=3142381 RepID=UPI0039A02B34